MKADGKPRLSRFPMPPAVWRRSNIAEKRILRLSEKSFRTRRNAFLPTETVFSDGLPPNIG
jgi:hypothetical protein